MGKDSVGSPTKLENGLKVGLGSQLVWKSGRAEESVLGCIVLAPNSVQRLRKLSNSFPKRIS